LIHYRNYTPDILDRCDAVVIATATGAYFSYFSCGRS
jgi:hypothetical protein